MSEPPNSILAGVDAIIDKHLFIENQFKEFRYQHQRSCNELSKNPPNNFDGLALISSINDRIEENLAKRPDRKVSNRNWILRTGTDQNTVSTSQENTSDEVTLERAMVQRWPDTWTYQMPIASGLFGPTKINPSSSGGRRAIDLICTKDKEQGYYDFVELKISSDNPLYAAMEILSYGLVYWASRQDKAKNLDYHSEDRPVLKARKITLCVLAPQEYYRRCSLEWLQTAINDGLKNFIQGDLSMDFRFEQFHFTWTHNMTANDLSEPLLREAVYQ